MGPTHSQGGPFETAQGVGVWEVGLVDGGQWNQSLIRTGWEASGLGVASRGSAATFQLLECHQTGAWP